MSRELFLQSRQRTRAVDLQLLRRITNTLLIEELAVDHFELGIHLVATKEMTRLNQSFLRHAGSTDVITFDHRGNDSRFTIHDSRFHGEIFICVDEAINQSRKYRTSWQSELIRYLVHGLLHLQGFDDSRLLARRKMKREEDRLLHELAQRFALSKLGRKPKVQA